MKYKSRSRNNENARDIYGFYNAQLFSEARRMVKDRYMHLSQNVYSLVSFMEDHAKRNQQIWEDLNAKLSQE